MCPAAHQVCAADYSSEQDYLQEFPVVLSASRLSQPLSEAPSAMTVIDREMIAASGFRKIPDLFKLVPGMYVSYYKGSQAIVSYHGTSDQFARRMQVLIDGRSVYLAPFSDVDWESLPVNLDDIERIEVVRGPSAAAHGANSLQGVINIITRDAGALAGASVSTTQGDKGVSDVSAHVGRRGEKLDYSLTLGYRSDNGYDPRTDVPNNDTLSNDSYATRLFNLRANYRPNFTDNLDVQAGVSNGTRGAGFTDSQLNTPHDLFARESYQQLTWQRALDNSDELQLRYYHIRLNREETTLSNLKILNQLVLPQFRLADSLLSDRNELELQHTAHLDDANRMVWGAAYRSDYIHAENYFLTPLRQNEYRLFAHDEWRISPAWLLNSGLMLENGGLGRTDSSPQIALNYHITPAHTLRAGVSRAYRNPAMLEEKGDWRYPLPQSLQNSLLLLGINMQNYPILKATGGLRPEQVISREVGYLGKLADYGVSIDFRIFHDQYSDIIVADPSYSPPSFTNASSSMGQSGAETSIEYRLAEQTRIIFNYSRNRISTDLTGFQGIMPEEQFGVMVAQRLGDYSFSLNYYNQSAALPPDINHLQEQHQRTDLRLAKSFKAVGGTSGELAVVVQNLFNTDYTEYIATNVFNRRSYATLTVNF
jgi:iron complex outermembrane receptor protein